MLSPYQRLAFRLFGAYADRAAHSHHHLRHSLQRSHLQVRPEVYLSTSFLNMVLLFALSLALVGFLLLLSIAGSIHLRPGTLILLIPLPALAAACAYLLTFVAPDVRALRRASDIDARLPYALNYVSTMAGAGITLDRILESLARQPVYGEVAQEASWIVRDMRLLGKDVTGALQAGIDRSPSQKFQDLLQGALSTIMAGSDLSAFFRAKAEQFMHDNRQEQRKTLESLGILSEAFVTVVVAAPIMVLIFLSVMTLLGTSASAVLAVGYVAVLLLLPAAQAGFVYVIHVLAPEP